MLNFLSYESRARNRAAPVLFALWIALQLVAVYALVRLGFRDTWDQHVAAGAGAMVLTGLVCGLVMCLENSSFTATSCTSRRCASCARSVAVISIITS